MIRFISDLMRRCFKTPSKEPNQVPASLRPIVVISMKPGEVVRQGYIYIAMIKEFDEEELGSETNMPQLVCHDSPVKLHKINDESMRYCRIWMPTEGADDLQGNYVEAKERWWLVHPEHRHFILPKGRYSITHQLDWSVLESQRLDN